LLGYTVVAGCSNIAVGQMCAYHKFPNYFPETGLPISESEWNLIRTVESYNNGVYNAGSNNAKNLVCLVISDLGKGNKSSWGIKQTSTSRANVCRYLLRLGYSNVSTFNYSHGGISTMLASGYPVLVRGDKIVSSNDDMDGELADHMWVIDGYGSVASLTGSSRISLVHCNFGWGGIADGWYTSGIFELYGSRWMHDQNVGDNIGVQNDYYQYNLKYIFYVLP